MPRPRRSVASVLRATAISVAAAGVVLLGGATIAHLAGEAVRNAPKPLRAGVTAPPIAGRLYFTGDSASRLFKPRTLADLRGHVVLVVFYYTGCSGCFTALPALSDLGQEYRDRGLRILAVNINPPLMAASDRQYLAKLEVRLDAVYDSLDAYHGYSVFGVPTVFLIDRDGRIARFLPGLRPDRQAALTDPEGHRLIDSLLAAPPRLLQSSTPRRTQ